MTLPLKGFLLQAPEKLVDGESPLQGPDGSG